MATALLISCLAYLIGSPLLAVLVGKCIAQGDPDSDS